MSDALTPTTYSEDDYQKLSEVFSGGDPSKATKAELQRYAVMLSRPKAWARFTGGGDYPQVCETVRMLILVRISEEANRAATRISIIALVVAIAAFIASVVQVGIGFGWFLGK